MNTTSQDNGITNRVLSCIQDLQEFDKIDKHDLMAQCIDERLNENLMEYAHALSIAVDNAKSLIAGSDLIKVVKRINMQIDKQLRD